MSLIVFLLFKICKNLDKAQYADDNAVIIADKSLNVIIMERKKNILSEMGNKDKWTKRDATVFPKCPLYRKLYGANKTSD